MTVKRRERERERESDGQPFRELWRGVQIKCVNEIICTDACSAAAAGSHMTSSGVNGLLFFDLYATYRGK